MVRRRQDRSVPVPIQDINDRLAEAVYAAEKKSCDSHGDDINAPDETVLRFLNRNFVAVQRSKEEYASVIAHETERLKGIQSSRLKHLQELRKGSGAKGFEKLLLETELWTKSAMECNSVSTPKKGGGANHRANRHEEDEDIPTSQMQTSRLTSTPPYLCGELRNYQIAGVNWLIGLFDNAINGILADEMGLGKTFQTISLLAYLKYSRGVPGPHLIMCPKSVLGNWAREIKQWCPSLRAYRFHAPGEIRGDMVKSVLNPSNMQYDIIITTYEMVNTEISAFKKVKWTYVIVDEAHRLKSEESMLATAVRTLNTSFRLLVTGTPLQNNLRELWALLNFLIPELYHNAEEFSKWFDTESGTQDDAVITRLYKLLTPLMLRRLKAEVNTNIPPKKEIYVECGLTPLQKEQYTAILAKDYETINKGTGTSTKLNNIMMQLRKSCLHPYLFPGVEDGPPFITNENLVQASGKLSLLDRILKRLHSEKEMMHKVLIFSQFTSMLDILEDYLNYRKIRLGRIDGNTSSVDRDKQMNEFNNPKSDMWVFLLSTRAGGLGINLQAANYVILYDSDWNPQQDLQAQDRAHRIGQKRSVTVLRFISQGTVEERMYQRALKKLYLDAVVVQQGRVQSKEDKLSTNEVMGMIKFGVEAMFKNKNKPLEEEDLDVLLNRGAKRIQDMQNDLLQKRETTLANFKLGIDETNIYEFEGINYSDEMPSKIVLLENIDERVDEVLIRETLTALSLTVQQVIINPNRDSALVHMKSLEHAKEVKKKITRLGDVTGVRVKFASKDVVITTDMVLPAEEEQLLGRGARARARDKLSDDRVAEYERAQALDSIKMPRVPKMPVIKPWHLLPRHALARVQELYDAEASLIVRKWEKQREQIKMQQLTNPPPLEEINPKDYELSEAEIKERNDLVAQAFLSWNANHFQAVVDLMAKYGRQNIDKIVENFTEKTAEETKTYCKAFWQHGPQAFPTERWQALLKKIETGENKAKRHAQMKEAIAWKLRKMENNPNEVLTTTNQDLYEQTLDYNIVKFAANDASVDAGNFEGVTQQLHALPECRFDFYVRTRNTAYVNRKYNALTTRILNEKLKAEGNAAPGGKRERTSLSEKKRAGTEGGSTGKLAKTTKGGGKKKGEDTPTNTAEHEIEN